MAGVLNAYSLAGYSTVPPPVSGSLSILGHDVGYVIDLELPGDWRVRRFGALLLHNSVVTQFLHFLPPNPPYLSFEYIRARSHVTTLFLLRVRDFSAIMQTASIDDQISSAASDRLKCLLCGRTFSRREHLERHSRIRGFPL